MTTHFRAAVIAATLACFALAGCGPANEQQSAAPAEEIQTEAASAGPANVGDCVEARVTLVGARLEGLPDSGSTIQYDNGLTQVEYDVLPGVVHSQVGDTVRVCLVSIPENCPPGDNRGRIYEATNLRTNESWSAPDSQHMCGGA